MKVSLKKIILCTIVFISYYNEVNAQLQDENQKPKERSYSHQERELEYLMTIWPGEYDNVEQLDFDKALKKDPLEIKGHTRVHSFVKRLEVPNFGAHVLYIEEYKNDDPSILSRQCIYKILADEKAKSLRIKVYHFKEPKPYLSLQKELDFVKILKPNASFLEAGCDLLLQREGTSFKGKTHNRSCLTKTKESTSRIDYQIQISENDYRFNDVKYDQASNIRLEDNLQPTPYQLKKARCFVCMVDFPNKKNGRPTITKYYITIHDQGGKFEFDYPDGRHMVLGMRNTWSFGMQRETFVIFIQEGSQKGPTLIYSWGEPGADRIGFNPGWIRIQCDLNTPKNVKLQHSLRPGS